MAKVETALYSDGHLPINNRMFDCEGPKKRRVLTHAKQAECDDFLWAMAVNEPPVDKDLTTVGAAAAGGYVEGSRFARAVLACEYRNLAARQRKVQTTQHPQAASESFPHVRELQRWVHEYLPKPRLP